jgi:hypothetical protein
LNVVEKGCIILSIQKSGLRGYPWAVRRRGSSILLRRSSVRSLLFKSEPRRSISYKSAISTRGSEQLVLSLSFASQNQGTQRLPWNRKSIIYIDVDDTLIRTFGTKQIPIPRSADYFRRMHMSYTDGVELEQTILETLRQSSVSISDLSASFLPKPDIVLDDRLEILLEHCEFIHPNNAH